MLFYESFNVDREGEGHEGFCVRSLKRNIPVSRITPTDDFNLFISLESFYPLLEIVFSYLNYNELKTCSQVKKSWKETAETVLRRRMKPSWFTCYKTYSIPSCHQDYYSSNLNYNNVGLGIILYELRRMRPYKYICIHSDISELDRKTVSVQQYLEDELIPKNVDYCAISCLKVASFFDRKSTEFRDIGLSSILDGLFLPKIENIKMVTFDCNLIQDNIENLLSAYKEPNDEAKCLIIFSATDNESSLHNLLKYMVPENTAASVALGGGIMKLTKTFKRNNRSERVYFPDEIFCIAFLKDKNSTANFDAFSYVIHGDASTRDKFAEQVLKFKEKIKLRTYAAAIRICCSEKVNASDEPRIFNNIFPNVPLLGFHAEREIGWNCVLSQEETGGEEFQAENAKHKYPKAYHHLSTVLVIITWGKVQT